MSIPRIIHQSWKTSTVPEAFRGFQERWRALHPGYEYRLWTDEDNAAFVRDEFPSLLGLYRSFSREIYRADLVRCLYLARFGGIYADLDIEPLRSLDPFLARTSECWLGSEPVCHALKRLGRPRMACNAVMGSVPNHPFWARMIDEMQSRAHGPHQADPVQVTGPIALDAAYHKHGAALGVTLAEPDAFFPLPDVNGQPLPLSRREKVHYQRMLELGHYPTSSWGVHHWAHTWIPNKGFDRFIRSSTDKGRQAVEVLRGRRTIDELARPARYGVRFPEAAFSPRAADAPRYRGLVSTGSKQAAASSITFLVMLHNRLDLALLLRARLERYAACFGRAKVLLLCDDSTDGTAQVMADWQRARPELVSNVPAPSVPPGLTGFARMSRLRNTLLVAGESEPSPDYVAVLDGDLEGPVSEQGLLHSVAVLRQPKAPDAVAALGVNNWLGVPGLVPFLGYSYYDPIAFREHCWQRVESDRGIRRRLGGLRRGGELLTVKSAFGGLTLYRGEALRGLRYDNETRDCEHVSLHRALAARGGSLVLNPSLLLLAGRQGHHQQRSDSASDRLLELQR
jgi:inositol phosphorylceramide mannosyltransferase catalytic subunit